MLLDGGSTSGEASAVDLQVLHYTLHVVAGLSEWDALDPVDRVDLRVAWIDMSRSSKPLSVRTIE